MGGTIRARVRGGILEPLERLDLPEGAEVLITILDTPAESNIDGFESSFGGWKGIVDTEALIENIRQSRAVSTRPVPRL
ncbi:MAG: antitoxin family protein [Candidatus Rokubacteria bacterium]|nr:antitoxin family protein [Candidatus Rokubacteria bacterium]